MNPPIFKLSMTKFLKFLNSHSLNLVNFISGKFSLWSPNLYQNVPPSQKTCRWIQGLMPFWMSRRVRTQMLASSLTPVDGCRKPTTSTSPESILFSIIMIFPQLSFYTNIIISQLHCIVARPLFMPYTNLFKWALDHENQKEQFFEDHTQT